MHIKQIIALSLISSVLTSCAVQNEPIINETSQTVTTIETAAETAAETSQKVTAVETAAETSAETSQTVTAVETVPETAAETSQTLTAVETAAETAAASKTSAKRTAAAPCLELLQVRPSFQEQVSQAPSGHSVRKQRYG